MAFTKALFVSYRVPTYYPADPSSGGVAAQSGAPTVVLTDADLQARAQRFLNVLYWAQAKLAAEKKDNINTDLSDPSVLKVFMAPEFYFRKYNPEDSVTGSYNRARDFWGHYPSASRQELLDALYAAIGNDSRFKDWTIVAGTICSWRQEDDSPKSAPARPFLMNTGLVVRGPRTTPDDSAPTLLVEKHYFSWIDLNYHDTTNDWWNVRRSLTSMFSERKEPDWMLSNLVNWDGMLQGIEICLDHANGVVARGLQELAMVYGKATYADLQLITSCGMSIVPGSVAVTPGNLVMLSDGFNGAQLARIHDPSLTADVVAPIARTGAYDLPADDANYRVKPVRNAGAPQGIEYFKSQALSTAE